ncbi:hypothetical protein ACYU03_14780 [Pseudomonas sp. X10]
MLKTVPDPPCIPKDTNVTLEDLLIQTSEYLVCALTPPQTLKPGFHPGDDA